MFIKTVSISRAIRRELWDIRARSLAAPPGVSVRNSADRMRGTKRLDLVRFFHYLVIKVKHYVANRER